MYNSLDTIIIIIIVRFSADKVYDGHGTSSQRRHEQLNERLTNSIVHRQQLQLDSQTDRLLDRQTNTHTQTDRQTE